MDQFGPISVMVSECKDIKEIKFDETNNNNGINQNRSKNYRKIRSLSAIIDSTEPQQNKNFLSTDCRLDLDYGNTSESDVSISSSPTPPRKSKAKGGWAKIKRELIAKERNKDIKDSSASTPEIFPMHCQKSPTYGKKSIVDDMNNNSSKLTNHSSNITSGNNNNNNNNFLAVDRNRSMKLLILGQDGVGKSAFTVRYLTRRYIGEYDPLLEGIFKKTIMFNNIDVLVEIKDTAKGINWLKRRNDLLWTDAIILIYSITNRSSFIELQNLTKQISHEQKTRGLSSLVIGNKTDLSHIRKVDTVEGSNLANSISGSFHELSISDNYTDLESVVNNFIRDNCSGLKYSTTQSHILSSRSSPEIRQKSMDRIYRPISVVDSENEGKTGKGRALWQKLRTNNELKKKK